MVQRYESWRRGQLVPSWLSVPLMILGVIYLVAEWSVRGSAVLIPIGIVVILGVIEQRRVRRVTVLERSARHVVWRIDYRDTDAAEDDL
jgi:membrane-bound ClpP family serine protease